MADVLIDELFGPHGPALSFNVFTNMAGAGNSFIGNGAKVTKARFFISGSDEGPFHALIYAHDGNWGSGLPSGTPLAVSDTIEELDHVDNWIDFHFTGINQFQTVAGTKYFVCFKKVDGTNLIVNLDVHSTIQSPEFEYGSSVYYRTYDSRWLNTDFYLNRIIFQLYGVFPTFNVTYNGNGATGGNTPIDNNAYTQGSTVMIAANTGGLTRTNYTFKGWATSPSTGTAPMYLVNNNGVVVPSSLVIGPFNVVLFAVWDLTSNQTFSVLYNGNGNTGGATPTDSSSPYQGGKTVTILGKGTLTKTGHAFLGWSTDNTATFPIYVAGSTFTINCAMVLYAVWVPTRTVTYNGNGNTSGSAPVDSNSPYNNGSTVTVLGQGTLSRTKHVFIGWSTDNSAFTAQYTPDATFTITGGDVVLYAVWRELCTVTYDGGNGGFGSVPVDVNSPYVAGSSVTVMGPGGLAHSAGFVFLGWYCSTDGLYYIENTEFTILEDMTMIAVWDPVPPTPYYVLYCGNGNTGGDVPVDRNAYATNSRVTVLGPNTLSKASHVFLGWAKKCLATVKDYSPRDKFDFKDPIVLYAVWSYTGSGGGSGHVVTMYYTINVPFDGRYAGSSGSKETTLSYAGTGNEAVLKVLSNLPNNIDKSAVVENLIIDGKNKPNTTGILLEDVCGCLVRNVTIMNCEVGIKVKLTGDKGVCAQGNRFEHIRMINVKTGILFEGTSSAKDFSYTTIEDVGISLAGNSSDVGIKVGTNSTNANLFSAFVKANVWLGKSKGAGFEVNGQLKGSIVNFAVDQESGYNGYGVRINSGATVYDNQSFLLSAFGLQTSPTDNRLVKGSGITYDNGITVVS